MLDIKFAKENKNIYDSNKKILYNVLIVDDEKSVHDITKIALSNMNFKEFEIKLFHAMNIEDAKNILNEHNDIALAFIDVVMESPTAGLDLVNIIRNEYKNEFIRLVIRTGQADNISKMDVIDRYDIDDFKEKTELTVERLYATIRNSIKQYIQLLKLEQKYQETYYQMTHSPLTKLPNRIQLSKDCENISHKTLILIDIVGFSMINDRNGFEVGDSVLKQLAAFLHSMYSADFNVYHLERDLFALTTINEEFNNLVHRIKEIKEDISKLQIVANNFNKTIDTTIGVAYQNGGNIMRKAELALKEARENGKNQIQFYSDDLKIIRRIENTNLWSSRIKEAISEDRLRAYYQPIVDTKTNEIVKYESLVRLEYEGTIYTPYHFLNAALYSGQLYDIFKFMFSTSCKKAKETEFKFSINVADTDLLHDDFIEFIQTTLDTYSLNSSYISLEILEHKSITSEMKSTIIELNSMGIEMLIDDFGVQCSNFGQLSDLPIDILKIDGSFIRDIVSNEENQIIVQTILLYAKKRDLKLVAEFVCDKEVHDYVVSLGVDYVQGYYLSEPLEDVL